MPWRVCGADHSLFPNHGSELGKQQSKILLQNFFFSGQPAE
jgi:hypothetical protein